MVDSLKCPKDGTPLVLRSDQFFCNHCKGYFQAVSLKLSTDDEEDLPMPEADEYESEAPIEHCFV